MEMAQQIFPCDICGDLQDSEDLCPPLKGDILDFPFVELQKSAARGCSGCSLLCNGIAECISENLAAQNTKISSLSGAVTLAITVKLDKGMRYELEFFASANKESEHSHPWSAIRSKGHTFTDLISSESLRSVRNWLDECRNSHPTCKTGGTSSQLPTRILDLGLPRSDSEKLVDGPVKLYERQSDQEMGQYVCLSHCWGNGMHTITTTSSTLNERRAGIPFVQLPRLFQDAVRIVRKMGQRYLWIDSLCILQNCPEDWEKESIKMASVYSNAYFTLAAIAAYNSSEACSTSLSNSDPVFREKRILGVSKDGYRIPVYVRPRIPHFILDAPQERWANFPLLTRGWVYQERLLSRRIVHFNKREIVWECNQYTACQCIPQARYPSDFKRWHSEVLGLDPDKMQADCSAAGRRWRQMMSEYTELGLTESSDRLPAIRGCAQQMRQCMSGRYLMGLWEDNLLDDLLWIPLDSERPAARPDEYRSPSWSWASMDGKVSYRHTSIVESYVRIDCIECRDDLTSPRAMPRSEALILQGNMVPAKLLRQESKTLLRRRPFTLQIQHCNLANVEDLEASDINGYLIPAYRLHLDVSVSFDTGDEQIVSLFRMARVIVYSEVEEYSLVLRRRNIANPEADNSYERIGIVNMLPLRGLQDSDLAPLLSRPNDHVAKIGDHRELEDIIESLWQEFLGTTLESSKEKVEPLIDWASGSEEQVVIL